MSNDSVKTFFVMLPLVLVNIQQFQKSELRVTTLSNKSLIVNSSSFQSWQNSRFNSTNNKFSYTKTSGQQSDRSHKVRRGSRRAFKLGPELILRIAAFMMVVLTVTAVFIWILFG